jgi:signal transduction histidine kinase
LVLVRLPAFAFGVLLLLVANTTLRQRKSLVLFVNNLFAISLPLMGIGFLVIAFNESFFQPSITAFVILSISTFFIVKGVSSIIGVYIIPLLLGVIGMIWVYRDDASKFQDLLNALMMYLGVIVVSLISERRRFRTYYYQKRLLIEKKQVDTLYNETQVQNQELMLLNEHLDKALNELTLSNKTKDTLFSLIAHDLRSPFNTLIGYSKLLLEQGLELSAKELENFHNQMLLVSENTYKLLQNLLHWSMAQSGAIQIRPASLSLKELLSEVEDEAKLLLKRKGLRLYIEIENCREIFADKEVLLVIMRNLLSNAIKFSYPNGEIYLSTKQFDDKVEIKIVDEGKGMSGETLKNIIGEEMVESREGTHHEKGTGLGLMLCRDLVSKSGGKMYFDSKENRGTSVIVELFNEGV